MAYNLKEHKQDNKNTEFTPLPEDRYNYKVTGAEVKRTSTDKDMINTTFEVIDGKYKGRLAWNNFVLTPKSMGFLLSFLTAVGSNLVDKEDVTAEQIAADVKNRTVSAYTVPEKTTQGKAVNALSRWQAVKTGDGILTTSTPKPAFV